MEWCHAIGSAHQTKPPRIACPSVSGRMFRWRANNMHIPNPPIKVTRNQNRVGPMQRGEDHAGNECGNNWAMHGVQQPVHQVGIDRDLLQEAESKVAQKSAMIDEVFRQVMPRSQSEPRSTNRRNVDCK